MLCPWENRQRGNCSCQAGKEREPLLMLVLLRLYRTRGTNPVCICNQSLQPRVWQGWKLQGCICWRLGGPHKGRKGLIPIQSP